MIVRFTVQPDMLNVPKVHCRDNAQVTGNARVWGNARVTDSVKKVENVFGVGSARVVLSQGKHELTIKPADPRAKKLFRPTSTRADTLESLADKVDAACAKAATILSIG